MAVKRPPEMDSDREFLSSPSKPPSPRHLLPNRAGSRREPSSGPLLSKGSDNEQRPALRTEDTCGYILPVVREHWDRDLGPRCCPPSSRLRGGSHRALSASLHSPKLEGCLKTKITVIPQVPSSPPRPCAGCGARTRPSLSAGGHRVLLLSALLTGSGNVFRPLKLGRHNWEPCMAQLCRERRCHLYAVTWVINT